MNNNPDKLKQEINNKCMEVIKEVYIIKYMFRIIYIYCLWLFNLK